MVRLTDRLAMTIAVDMGRKAAKQTHKRTPIAFLDSYLTQYLYENKGFGLLV